MDENNTSNEKLRAMPIISALLDTFRKTEMEMIDNSGVDVNMQYPNLKIFVTEVEVHGMLHEAYKDYKESTDQLNKRFGDIDEREWNMRPLEALKRFKNTLILAQNIGLYQIDPRMAYAEPRKEDDIDFSGFDPEQ